MRKQAMVEIQFKEWVGESVERFSLGPEIDLYRNLMNESKFK